MDFTTLRPTLERVRNDCYGLDEELIMFLYHKLNGRDDEAQTYLETYKYNATQIKTELIRMPIVEQIKCDDKV